MSVSRLNRRRFLQNSVCPVAVAAAGLATSYTVGRAESPATVSARSGIVAAGPPAAPAEAGVEMLQTGGNAIDAAVAAALVESVVNPNVSGIGGSGGMVVYLAAERRCLAIDYNTRAPARIDQQAFKGVLEAMTSDRKRRLRDAGWNPYQLMTVPGCLAGLELAVRRHGRKRWSDVVAPAVEALAGGLVVHERLARELPGIASRCDDDRARRLLTLDGQAPGLGDRLPLEPFVELLQGIAENGAEWFYRGEPAERLIRCVEQHGGTLSRDDLAGYRAREVEPIRTTYRGYDVHTCPPTLGGATVLEALNVLAGCDLASLGHGTPEWADLLVRVYRLVWRDRLERLGDTAAARADLGRLLSADYAAELRGRLSEAGRPAAPDSWRGGPGTIHISAADGEGNLVALTQSLIGGSHFVADIGLLMNQSLIMFDPRPGHPNGPGPRKQPLVNMSPMILTRAGRPMFALGAPGSRKIVSVVSQIIVNLVDFDMGPSEALAAPRIHCEAAGPVLVEACAGTSLPKELKARGHAVNVVKRVGALGHIAGVDHDAQGLVGASDPRSERSQWNGRTGTVADFGREKS